MIHNILSIIIIVIVVNSIEIKYIVCELLSHVMSNNQWILYFYFLDSLAVVVVVSVINFIDSIDHQRSATLKRRRRWHC